jgi:putative addiction module killer protein
VARVNRVAAGMFGDCKPLREGVQELKIDFGPGYRVYLSKQGQVLVLLLCGGDKSDQNRDIERAIAYLKDWKQRGKP